jgi:hypothetical protein
VSGKQCELFLELAEANALGSLVAKRQCTGERDQAPGVDARAGRVPIDEQGQHREPVAAALDLDAQTWLLASGHLGELLAADLHGNTRAQGGEHLADELGGVFEGVIATAG